MKASLEELDPLFDNWLAGGHGEWCDVVRANISSALDPDKNGHMQKWHDAIERVSNLAVTGADFSSNAVTIEGQCSSEEKHKLNESLQAFHPWRKGPFNLFGIQLDAEWRSDSKWSRVSRHIDLAGKYVLDVGCGNGYYGWRMLGEGAAQVVGLEPYPLYNMQYRLLKQFVPDTQNYVIAGNDRLLGSGPPKFDLVFSMGVFYHCKNPVGHLETLRRAMKPNGTLVLETLVVDGDAEHALIPEDRYAKMRNVWLIPSTLMLERLLKRCQFRNVEVVDICDTTSEEQRRTDWMTFESLADFLDPADASKTIEGYPGPKRAVILAS